MAFERIPQGELIMTPDSPWFYEILQDTAPPGWKQGVDSDYSGVFTVDLTTGILRPANLQELDEYVLGGEYDEILGDEDECLLLT